ncbi:MAG: hypothetical protein II652_00445 [Bacteroidales bacterium]|nr:hypothetical protein [Bacteroidales bacterium]
MKEEMSLKEKGAPLPSTSPALPDVWVGECPVSWPPAPTPRMLGRSSSAGVSTGDVRHPLPPFTAALPVLAQVGFRRSSGPLCGVATGDGRHL